MCINITSVLIVDDCLPDRIFLKYDLEKASYAGKIFESIDGEDAINFLKDYEKNKVAHGDNYPPELIFLDINMPKMNGFDFLDALKKMRSENKACESIVIVMISSSAMQDDIEKSLSYPFVKQYLIKGSYTLDELKALLS